MQRPTTLKKGKDIGRQNAKGYVGSKNGHEVMSSVVLLESTRCGWDLMYTYCRMVGICDARLI